MKKTIRSRVTIIFWSLLILGSPFRPAAASCPLQLWSNGKYRQKGRVEVTGKPGREYYMQVGPWTYWYKNGQKRKEGVFKEGTPVGEWSFWYKNGVRMKKGAYNNDGREDGPWKYWYENGLDNQEGDYHAGRPTGHWIYRYNQVDGRKRREGKYINGLETGHWIYWYKDGKKQKEGAYINGLEDGPWTFWYEDGRKKCEGSFKASLEEGEWTYWERSGEGKEKKEWEWTYSYREVMPSEEERKAESLSSALVGHWISEKVLSTFKRSQTLPEDSHHLYFRPAGGFTEVMDGEIIDIAYTVEDEDPPDRLIRVRFTSYEGRGAVLSGKFSEDYRKLAGLYYLVDFLRGSREKANSYFIMRYAGNETGPERLREPNSP
ncbi:MAG: toxin-antitoxin system YwqK family antitoxin [Candidatus Euphemobacter frigidus]|nr:toxin-antitoxin system YwqK family antitoxin [Candidatus Euphemobacter frigidus]MDP8275237.1 toxin-antitoxin system YwqK family antitoxin [Candidatus Euphemobacter frigidus]